MSRIDQSRGKRASPSPGGGGSTPSGARGGAAYFFSECSPCPARDFVARQPRIEGRVKKVRGTGPADRRSNHDSPHTPRPARRRRHRSGPDSRGSLRVVERVGERCVPSWQQSDHLGCRPLCPSSFCVGDLAICAGRSVWLPKRDGWIAVALGALPPPTAGRC